MKKVLSLLLLIVLGLMVTQHTKAYYQVVLYNAEWTIEGDYTPLMGYYDATNDRLYARPSHSSFDTSNPDHPNGFNISSDSGEQIIIDNADDLQSLTESSHYYNITIFYEISTDDPLYRFSDGFNFVVLKTNGTNYYYKIPYSVTSNLRIDIEIGIDVVDDGGTNVVDNTYTTGNVWVNSVLWDEVPNDGWTLASLYITNVGTKLINNFTTLGNFNYWHGYDEETLKSGFDFTHNYFVKYVLNYYEDLAIDENQFNDWVSDEVLRWRNGITITLPPNNGFYIFNPSIFQQGSNLPYWFKLSASNTVSIKIPDLTSDSGEIWGNTLQYIVGANTYTYNLVDEFDNTIPPIFGIRVAKDFYSITYNSRGGSAVSTQYASELDVIYSPTKPTYSGYEFLGWTRDQSVPSIVGYDVEFIYSYPASRGQLQEYPFTFRGNLYEDWVLEDVTQYAVWRPIPIYVSIYLNGGTNRNTGVTIRDTIVTTYGESAINNYYDIDFTNSYYRLGHTLEGFYQDEALTVPFNINTPLTSNINVYIKWELGTLGGESPFGLNQVMSNLGLLNDVGTFFVYMLLVILLFIPIALLKLPMIMYMIINITISGVWLFLGWFNAFTMILVVLANVLIFFTVLRRM